MASKTMFNFVIGFLDILSIFIFINKKDIYYFNILLNKKQKILYKITKI
jgi:hypothetical protein